MGHGIAQASAMAGYRTLFYARSEGSAQRCLAKIEKSLSKFVLKGKLTESEMEEILHQRLVPVYSMEEGIREADLIVESIPEILDDKLEVFRAINANAKPDAIITSNTSTIRISNFATVLDRPENLIGLHFFNPVVIMKLVEIIRVPATSDETVARAEAFVRSLPKVPVIARKDVVGFIVNRVTLPVSAYILKCLYEKDGIPFEELDAGMRKSGDPMGYFELRDFTGIDVSYNVGNYCSKALGEEYAPAETLKKLISEGRLGKKAGRGFYDWSNGRPVIDLTLDKGRYNAEDCTIIRANEACKLVDEGVCSFEDVDLAVRYGLNLPGPIEAIQGFRPEELAARLNGWAERYGMEMFRPAASIVSGAYLKN